VRAFAAVSIGGLAPPFQLEVVEALALFQGMPFLQSLYLGRPWAYDPTTVEALLAMQQAWPVRRVSISVLESNTVLHEYAKEEGRMAWHP
jgi:hypothetical protein